MNTNEIENSAVEEKNSLSKNYPLMMMMAVWVCIVVVTLLYAISLLQAKLNNDKNSKEVVSTVEDNQMKVDSSTIVIDKSIDK